MLQQIFVDTHCAGLCGAERTEPFGPETVVWRVEGHMFAAYTTDGQGISLRNNGGTRRDRPSPIHGGPSGGMALSLAGPGWVLLSWDVPPDALRQWIDVSYRLVRYDWRLVTQDAG